MLNSYELVDITYGRRFLTSGHNPVTIVRDLTTTIINSLSNFYTFFIHINDVSNNFAFQSVESGFNLFVTLPEVRLKTAFSTIASSFDYYNTDISGTIDFVDISNNVCSIINSNFATLVINVLDSSKNILTSFNASYGTSPIIDPIFSRNKIFWYYNFNLLSLLASNNIQILPGSRYYLEAVINSNIVQILSTEHDDLYSGNTSFLINPIDLNLSVSKTKNVVYKNDIFNIRGLLTGQNTLPFTPFGRFVFKKAIIF
jgi:hypothetical protein